jgi:hypothetical protein
MIIGISGKMCSGKNYTSKYIKNEFPDKKFKIKNFGYDVKKITSYLTGVNMKTILSRKAKQIYLPEWNMTIGEMFQKIGTDCLRDKLHQDVWILSLFSKYTADQNWIISDVRFINEADYIKKLGGIIIRLNGDPMNMVKYETRDINHISETELDDYKKFDILFDNKVNANFKEMLDMIKNKLNF